jgi:hypothetical protein
VTDPGIGALRAELARAEQAYNELSAMLALAKAEAGLDPTEDQQVALGALGEEWRGLLRALLAREEALASECRDAAEPRALSFYTLGLPDFAETSVEWEEGRLTVRRRQGGDERQGEIRPTPAEWAHFWSALDASRAWEWAGSHEGGGLDGVEWSLDVGHGGKRLTCRGRNASPTGFDLVVAALDRLVGGAISTPSPAMPVSPVGDPGARGEPAA